MRKEEKTNELPFFCFAPLLPRHGHRRRRPSSLNLSLSLSLILIFLFPPNSISPEMNRLRASRVVPERAGLGSEARGGGGRRHFFSFCWLKSKFQSIEMKLSLVPTFLFGSRVVASLFVVCPVSVQSREKECRETEERVSRSGDVERTRPAFFPQHGPVVRARTKKAKRGRKMRGKKLEFIFFTLLLRLPSRRSPSSSKRPPSTSTSSPRRRTRASAGSAGPPAPGPRGGGQRAARR